MTDLQNLFLAAYPLFPKNLIEKFDSLLSLEVARFNPEINTEILRQFNALSNIKKIPVSAYLDNQNYILQPSDRFIKSVYYGREIVKLYSAKYYGYFYEPLSSQVWVQGKVAYDSRIYENLSISIGVDYTDDGIKIMHSYIFIMSYNSDVVDSVTPHIVLNIVATLKKYNGAKTVLAMVENGIDVPCDKKLLTEFVTFLNAYEKYSAQLSAENNFQAEKNKQQIIDYKNDLSEKLKARKNELQDTKTQIIFAAKNELASAKRDMQNLSLTAQNLILTLQEKLGAK